MVAVQTAGRSRSLTFDPTVALFGTVAFTGAALLFLIEPVVAKMALPRLGGSPAVWNTSLMFFQIVLLVGYGYAHLSTQRLGLRAQVTVHAVALAAPLLVLPIALPHWSPPGASAPIPWLLGLLVVTVGPSVLRGQHGESPYPALVLGPRASTLRRPVLPLRGGQRRKPARPPFLPVPDRASIHTGRAGVAVVEGIRDFRASDRGGRFQPGAP